jgi:hypothetical protein
MTRFTCLFFAVVFSVINLLYAQPKAEFELIHNKHPEQIAVFTDIHETVNISVLEGKLNIKRRVEKNLMLLDDRAAVFSEGSVAYSSLIYLNKIEASTLYPAEKKYKEIKVTEFKDKDDLSGGIFHDDVKVKKFNFPSLVKGAIRKVVLNFEVRDPYMLTPFHIQEGLPVENTELTIVCDEGVELGYKIFNGSKADIAFTTRKESGKTIYSWKAKNVEKYESEDNAPDELYYAPHIIYYIKNYKLNGEKKRVLESLDDLHAYYNKLIENLNTDTKSEIKTFVDSLVKDLSADEAKIKAIYYWVKDNIKYIAFESGYEGFIPRQSIDVFNKRYGDCKDMSSIITDMLKYAGIESYLTWIGSREIPYKYTENHTMNTDNHMIAAVKLNGNYIFLDATAPHTPFGYPSSFIQGKEAMINISKDKYELVTVPVVEASKNMIKDSVYIEMTKDFKIIGDGVVSYSGYERDNILYRLNDSSKEKRQSILRSYFQKGSNKFYLDFFEEKNITNIDEDYVINYRFNISDYVLSSDNEIFVNLNLDKIYDKSSIDKSRKSDFEYSYKRKFYNIVVFRIPDGYELNYLPSDNKYSDENLSVEFSYKIDGNKITLKTIIEFKYLILEKKNFENWNNFVALLKKNYSESISLKKKV